MQKDDREPVNRSDVVQSLRALREPLATLTLAATTDDAAWRVAESLAGDLGRPLVRVDLGQMVSKYIGETEKNLANMFADAETAGAILFFDEADALFGSRGSVKDSHDRYAGLDLGSLRRRIETYPGLAILRTRDDETITDDTSRRRRYHLVVSG